MDGLPNKIIQFDVIKVNRDCRKICTCRENQYELDAKNRIVKCMTCGAILDPFDVLERLADYGSDLQKELDTMFAQAEELRNYKPYLKIIKKIESIYRAGGRYDLMPVCPKCHKPFDLSELQHTQWVDKRMLFQEE